MNRKIFFISVGVLIIDQVVKSIIGVLMTLNQSIPVIKNIFSITYFHNYGAAWGIFQKQTFLLIGVTLLALILIYRYMYSFQRNKRNNIAFGLLTGGIISNLIDRIFLGYVIDFFDFNIFGYDFPVFNIGDSCIVIGVILLIYGIIKGEDKVEKNSSEKSK